VPLAALMAALGWLVLGGAMGQHAAANEQHVRGYQAGGLALTVDQMPMAVLAACIGLRLASRMGLDGPGWAAALNKAAVVSLIFTLLAVPSAAAYFAIGRSWVHRPSPRRPRPARACSWRRRASSASSCMP
jgi:hypothetical protein